MRELFSIPDYICDFYLFNRVIESCGEWNDGKKNIAYRKNTSHTKEF